MDWNESSSTWKPKDRESFEISLESFSSTENAVKCDFTKNLGFEIIQKDLELSLKCQRISACTKPFHVLKELSQLSTNLNRIIAACNPYVLTTISLIRERNVEETSMLNSFEMYIVAMSEFTKQNFIYDDFYDKGF